MRKVREHNYARGHESLPSPDVVLEALKHMGLPGGQEGIGWLKTLLLKGRSDMHNPIEVENYDE